MITNSKRPKFLNLFKIHLPVTGVTSFAHRVSGALLFLSLPFWVYVFTLSLQSEAAYEMAASYMTNLWVKLITLLLFWSVLHHLLAGIRFLLLDIRIGHSLKAARFSAWLVNFTGVLLFLFVALWWLR